MRFFQKHIKTIKYFFNKKDDKANELEKLKVSITHYIKDAIFANEKYKFNGRTFRLGINYVRIANLLCEFLVHVTNL